MAKPEQRVTPCSIVILAHNGSRFTRICLESICKAQTVPQELIVVDNGSTDDTPSVLNAARQDVETAGITYIMLKNDENLGCSLARNLAWAKATQPYVVFMDNDTAVCTPDYLARLCRHMDDEPSLGVLGPKLIYPYIPHTIQCAGCMVNPMGRVRFRGRGKPRFHIAFSRTMVVPVLISACWIMRREFLDTLDGLDELFHPVQYEDLDFCMRVNQVGYHCAYTPEVEIYHFEGVTTESFGKKEYQRNIAAQSLKFKKRWRDVIKAFPPDHENYRWLDDRELGLDPKLILDLTME